jgi:hypothetical protein
VLQRARDAVDHHQRQHELLPLDRLARELHVHIRTLQAAVRTGRLDAHFSVSQCLADLSDWPHAPPPSTSWPSTTAVSAGKRSARLPCHPYRRTTILDCERCGVGSD